MPSYVWASAPQPGLHLYCAVSPCHVTTHFGTLYYGMISTHVMSQPIMELLLWNDFYTHVMSQPILELFTMDWFLHTCHVTTHFWDSLLWNDFYTCSLLFPFCLTVIHPNRSFVEVILILLSKCACIIIFKRKWVRFRSALLGIESNTFATDVASCYFLYNSDWYKRILRVTLILIQYLPV